jgi:hypothetical protein
MNGAAQKTSIKQTMTSSGFMRDVSGLLLFLAGITAIVGIAALFSRRSNPNQVSYVVGVLLGVVIYVVLAIKIRRGSVPALITAGVLYSLDSLYVLATPSASAGGLFSRIIVVYFVWRSFRKHQESAP